MKVFFVLLAICFFYQTNAFVVPKQTLIKTELQAEHATYVEYKTMGNGQYSVRDSTGGRREDKYGYGRNYGDDYGLSSRNPSEYDGRKWSNDFSSSQRMDNNDRYRGYGGNDRYASNNNRGYDRYGYGNSRMNDRYSNYRMNDRYSRGNDRYSNYRMNDRNSRGNDRYMNNNEGYNNGYRGYDRYRINDRYSNNVYRGNSRNMYDNDRYSNSYRGYDRYQVNDRHYNNGYRGNNRMYNNERYNNNGNRGNNGYDRYNGYRNGGYGNSYNSGFRSNMDGPMMI